MMENCDPVKIITFFKRLLPQGSEKVLFVVSTYSTLLSIVDQASSKEAAKDSNNETIFRVSDEIVNVTVAEISNAVLWNCRDSSITRLFYQRFYIAIVTCLLAYVVVFMTSFTKNCCTKKFGDFDCFQLASDILIRISLLLIVTSYDIDPWACFGGPSNITYNEFDQTVKLTFSENTLNYQKVAPLFSLVIGIWGWIISAIGQVYYNYRDPDPDAKERKYTVTYKTSDDDFEFTNINSKEINMTDITEEVDTENYVKMFVL